MRCPKNLHDIRGPNDINNDGSCAECVRIRGRKYVQERKEALALSRELARLHVPLDAALIARTFHHGRG